MPLFDYRCERCGQTKEVLVKETTEPVYCCGIWATRLPSTPGMFRVRGYNAGNGYSIPKLEDFDDSNVPSTARERVEWENQGRIPKEKDYIRG